MTSDHPAPPAAHGLRARAGKYLTFELGDEVYGFEIMKVQEIIGLMRITRVPRLPDYVRGVINLRGQVVPVVDLRLKFGLDARGDTERTCIIVVQAERDDHRATMGILVDEVFEVLDIAAEALEAPPELGGAVATDFLLGMAKVGERVYILLDIDRILSRDEIDQAAQAS